MTVEHFTFHDDRPATKGELRRLALQVAKLEAESKWKTGVIFGLFAFFIVTFLGMIGIALQFANIALQP